MPEFPAPAELLSRVAHLPLNTDPQGGGKVGG